MIHGVSNFLFQRLINTREQHTQKFAVKQLKINQPTRAKSDRNAGAHNSRGKPRETYDVLKNTTYTPSRGDLWPCTRSWIDPPVVIFLTIRRGHSSKIVTPPFKTFPNVKTAKKNGLHRRSVIHQYKEILGCLTSSFVLDSQFKTNVSIFAASSASHSTREGKYLI